MGTAVGIRCGRLTLVVPTAALTVAAIHIGTGPLDTSLLYYLWVFILADSALVIHDSLTRLKRAR